MHAQSGHNFCGNGRAIRGYDLFLAASSSLFERIHEDTSRCALDIAHSPLNHLRIGKSMLKKVSPFSRMLLLSLIRGKLLSVKGEPECFSLALLLFLRILLTQSADRLGETVHFGADEQAAKRVS